jgi:hypothetical protein
MTCVARLMTAPGSAGQQSGSFPRWIATRIARPAGDLARSRQISSANPYWNRCGRTFLDPDGYRLVIATTEQDL